MPWSVSTTGTRASLAACKSQPGGSCALTTSGRFASIHRQASPGEAATTAVPSLCNAVNSCPTGADDECAHITVTRNPKWGRRRARKATNSSRPPASSTGVTMRQCILPGDTRNSFGFGRLLVGIEAGAAGAFGATIASHGTSGFDQSSTMSSLPEASSLLMNSFFAIRLTLRGSRQEFRCAQSVARPTKERSL